MELPHYEDPRQVPEHLTTRAGLRQQGIHGPRPQPVATVTQFGKQVFLYDLRGLDAAEPPAAPARRRVRT